MAKNSKKRQDDAAAKAKKQKTILIVAGVLFLGLGAIQGPKLMKQLNPPAPEVAATAPSGIATTPAPATVTGTPIVQTSSNPGPTAILAGVTISSGGGPVPADGQLRSFSLFESKDPFVPQASDAPPAGAGPDAGQAAAPSAPETPAAAPSASVAGGADPAAPAPQAAPAPTDATVLLNGKAYPLTVKGVFPKAEPLFVLVEVKPKLAKVGVAGGSFADGKTIDLRLGKKVMLVNDATGARYALRLVYTGAGPEPTESFTRAAEK